MPATAVITPARPVTSSCLSRLTEVLQDPTWPSQPGQQTPGFQPDPLLAGTSPRRRPDHPTPGARFRDWCNHWPFPPTASAYRRSEEYPQTRPSAFQKRPSCKAGAALKRGPLSDLTLAIGRFHLLLLHLYQLVSGSIHRFDPAFRRNKLKRTKLHTHLSDLDRPPSCLPSMNRACVARQRAWWGARMCICPMFMSQIYA